MFQSAFLLHLSSSIYQGLEVMVRENGFYTKPDICKLIGVKPRVLEKISRTIRYGMPKAVGRNKEGVVFYNVKEINTWLPWIRELAAFEIKPSKLTISGSAVYLVEFMKKNKAIIKHCDAARRQAGCVYKY
jgi:hypothetical protein